MESIGKFFKEEKDFLFIKGREQGREEGLTKKNLSFTESLILQTAFDNKKIARLVGVSEDFVRDVRENLKNSG